MKTNTKESGFENHIINHLVEINHFIHRQNTKYDKKSCLDIEVLFEFLHQTQGIKLDKLKNMHGDNYKLNIIKRLFSQIKQVGIIQVLKNGITDNGEHLTLFYPLPVSNLNPDSNELYSLNIFSVIQQVYYSEKNNNSLDLLLFINGIPIISCELKNELSGQNFTHAIAQYQNDREPNEAIFNLNRLIVNFALDSSEIYMCTHLKGKDSIFLPFNKGFNNGAGNPVSDGLKTKYLWEDIFTKNNLAKIISDFVVYSKQKDTLIFPRYHQFDVVNRLLNHAKSYGLGQKYLIQHSAGSGKSNSIAWLAHQLVSLHDEIGQNTIFDSILVVTDRKVLDKQIQDNIQDFSKTKKLVEAITDGSKQLKVALENGKKIIISTIQKFPYILDEIQELNSNKFAIIIDEAHSSLSGENASSLNQVLAKNSQDNDDENQDDDIILKTLQNRKMLDNASYFAFTATPKNKTLELFGNKFIQDGKTKFQAFHLYSMKQAIEENFIMDVLKNYTTYKSYYALYKTIEDDPKYDSKQAQRKLNQYVQSHEHAIMEKTKVMINHFIENIINKNIMQGQAKAMLVCSSRQNAISYKKSFDTYLSDLHQSFKSIVAFSGEIDGETESSINGFSSSNIVTEFKKNNFKFLIVANKYQTGFDEPLLHTMYVDKKLGGVNAVQTLSRLNRCHPLKKETFILDFVNDTDNIIEAFSPYYEASQLEGETNPNKLFDLKSVLDNSGLYIDDEVDFFCNFIMQNANINNLHNILDTCSQRFQKMEQEEKINLKDKVIQYIRLYIYLSQLICFESIELEKLYIFLKELNHKLFLDKNQIISPEILKNIDIDSYKIQLESTQSLNISQGCTLQSINENLNNINNDNKLNELLSDIIDKFNSKHKTEFADMDRVRKMAEDIDIYKNQEVKDAFEYSDEQNIKIICEQKLSVNYQNILMMNLSFISSLKIINHLEMILQILSIKKSEMI